MLMGWENWIALGGVIVTLILGIYNLLVNKEIKNSTRFIDTITAERIKWLEKLRVDISRFLV
ncbi:hypothetical protein [Halalkalibacter okhensis]|uniref:Uncharacterized protein n=1 Tax=Halalkalibacter okhensis TaxID=333138 RepID=A0A0B0I6A0_9BACI|nr:hypothetical protein [Halalkalibacter okhensis]KHF37978.1 hypothetical protein LQ50_24230 [Halalkalibacter okhensis]